MEIARAVVNLLVDRGYKIACAESCTGGLLAAAIVDVPGASRVLDMSFITYSNAAKVSLCGVSERTLERYGAVSEQTVKEMAVGCAKYALAQVGVGVSGIAGPDGAVPGKPVGTVCFCIAIKDKTECFTERFEGADRTEIRLAAVDFILKKLWRLI